MTTADDHSRVMILSGTSSEGERVVPSQEVLQMYPSKFRTALNDMATLLLRFFLLPKIKMWLRKHGRKALGGDETPPMTVEVMRRQKIFNAWPSELLEEAIRCLKTYRYYKGEYIIHEGEPGTGILFLVSGSIEVLKRKDGNVKKLGLGNRAYLTVLYPVAVIGEFTALTNDKRMASIRAVTDAVVLFLSNTDLSSLLPKLSVQAVKGSMLTIMQKRAQGMANSQLTNDELRSYCPLLQKAPDDALDHLRTKLEPVAFYEKVTIQKIASRPDRIYFFVNGKCYKSFGGTERVLIKAPCTFGHTEVFLNRQTTEEITTAATSDFWVLWKSDFESIRIISPHAWITMTDIATEQSAGNRDRYTALAHTLLGNVPTLRDLTAEERLELFGFFEVKLYNPLQLVVTKSEVADRIIILVGGRVLVVGKGCEVEWKLYEAVGYTCLFGHRWQCTAVAQSVVECLELPSEPYIKFLTETNHLGTARDISRWLMFPATCTPREVAQFGSVCSGLTLYPVSGRPRVNCIEEGFVEVVKRKEKKEVEVTKAARRTKICNRLANTVRKVRTCNDLQTRLHRIRPPRKEASTWETLVETMSSHPTLTLSDFDAVPSVNSICMAHPPKKLGRTWPPLHHPKPPPPPSENGCKTGRPISSHTAREATKRLFPEPFVGSLSASIPRVDTVAGLLTNPVPHLS